MGYKTMEVEWLGEEALFSAECNLEEVMKDGGITEEWVPDMVTVKAFDRAGKEIDFDFNPPFVQFLRSKFWREANG